MSEQRLIEIETKLAHQEMLIEELNGVIATQQTTIDQMEKVLTRLVKKASDLDANPLGPADQKPPHY